MASAAEDAVEGRIGHAVSGFERCLGRCRHEHRDRFRGSKTALRPKDADATYAVGMSIDPTWPLVFTALRRSVRGFRQIPIPVREELAQEAIARALGVADVEAPLALTRRIARNLAVDWLRRRREEHLHEQEAGSDGWQAQMHARLDAQRAVAVLERAPPSYREVVHRCFLEDVDVDTLIDEECRPGEARGRVQDRIYKRRTRGLAWTRRALEAC